MKKNVSLILTSMFMSFIVLICFPVHASADNEICEHYIDDYESCVSLDDKYHSITGICPECGEKVTLKEEHYAFDYIKVEKLNKTYHEEIYECEECGKSYKEKWKHDWDAWEVTKKAKCFTDGVKKRTCLDCDAVQKKSISAAGEHNWGTWKTKKKSTIFKKGEKVKECKRCGKIKTKTTARVKPFAKFKAKKYSLTAGKTLKLKSKIKMARGDAVKAWKSSNNRIASVSKYGKIKAKSKGTVKIIAVLKSGKKATCTVKVKAKKIPKKNTQKKSSGGGTVYWVPSGSVYHVSRYCRTLSRSKVVYSGTIQQSGKSRCCRVCG